jgi:hypothetical protein
MSVRHNGFKSPGRQSTVAARSTLATLSKINSSQMQVINDLRPTASRTLSIPRGPVAESGRVHRCRLTHGRIAKCRDDWVCPELQKLLDRSECSCTGCTCARIPCWELRRGADMAAGCPQGVQVPAFPTTQILVRPVLLSGAVLGQIRRRRLDWLKPQAV